MEHQVQFQVEPFEFYDELGEESGTFGEALEFTDQEVYSEVSGSAPKTIARYNTNLDAPNIGGKFDFLFNGGSHEAITSFNTFYSFRGRFSDQKKGEFKERLRSAVAVWDGAAEVQVKDNHGNYRDSVKLRFRLNIVQNPKHVYKMTDVHPDGSRSVWFIGKGRETVILDLNVFIGSSRNALVHELGHVWGLLDEYDTRWYEKKLSPGHVGPGSPLIKDRLAIMNEGYFDVRSDTGQFRGRYFKHFGRAILNSYWGVKDFVIPIKHNGKVVARSVQGRIALLKKDIAGSSPYTQDVLPFNPRYTLIQVTKQ
jgi:hypothetical protein